VRRADRAADLMRSQTPGESFGQNGNYLSELKAQPGGPEGRPHTTTGSKPIPILGRPPGCSARSLNSDQCVAPNLPEIRREHPVPGPVSFSRTDALRNVQRHGAGIFTGAHPLCFNHARYDAFGNLAAEYASELVASPPCVTCYVSDDLLGSTRMVTDQTGAVQASHDYYPYGAEVGGGSGQPRSPAWGTTDYLSQKYTGRSGMRSRGWIIIRRGILLRRWEGL